MSWQRKKADTGQGNAHQKKQIKFGCVIEARRLEGARGALPEFTLPMVPALIFLRAGINAVIVRLDDGDCEGEDKPTTRAMYVYEEQ